MKQRLKIGFVLDDSLDSADGVQQYVLTLGTWLSAQGHDVHYLVGETKRTDMSQLYSLSRNVHLRFNSNRMSVPLPAARQAIAQLLERQQFDVLHVQVPYSPWMGGRVIQAASQRTAIVGTFHVAPASKLVTAANHALRRLLRTSLPRIDQMISVSSVAQAFAQATFHVSGPVIPNPVELRRFQVEPNVHAQIQPVTVVFLGRLVARKGCQDLLETVAAIREQKLVKTPWHLIIGGAGPLESQLKRYVRTQKLSELVSFAGFIAEADKAKFLSSADMAVFPSTGGESFGIVLLEAMASGVAVLAADNPGYHTVLESLPTALFEPAQPQVLAQRLAVCIDDKAAREWLELRQHDLVQRYDVTTVGPQVVAVYKAALRQRRSQEIM